MRKIWIGLAVIIVIVCAAYGFLHTGETREFRFLWDYMDNLQQFKTGPHEISHLALLRDQMRIYSSNRNENIREATEMLLAGYDELIDALEGAPESPEAVAEAYGMIFQSSIAAGRVLIGSEPGGLKEGHLKITFQEREQLREKLKGLQAAERYTAEGKEEKIADCRDILANILNDRRYKAKDE